MAWSYDTSADGPAAQFHGDALVTDRLVLVGSDSVPRGYLYALERSSGAVRWKHPFAGGVGAAILRRGDLAFAVSAAGEVAAVDLESGAIAWRTPPSELAGDRTLDPALDGDRLFVGWRAGTVEALEAATGRRIWQTPLGATLSTSLAVAGASVVVGTMDGRLHRLSREDGGVLSSLVLRGLPYGDLVEAGDCLLVLSGVFASPSSPSGPSTLSCVDPSLSRTLWSFQRPGELTTFRPLIHRGRAVVGSAGSLVALDLGTGSEAWSCRVAGTPRGLGESGDVVYVGTLSGQVLALDPARCAGPPQ